MHEENNRILQTVLGEIKVKPLNLNCRSRGAHTRFDSLHSFETVLDTLYLFSQINEAEVRELKLLNEILMNLSVWYN